MNILHSLLQLSGIHPSSELISNKYHDINIFMYFFQYRFYCWRNVSNFIPKNMDSSLDCNLKCTFGNGQTLKIVDRPNIGKLSTWILSIYIYGAIFQLFVLVLYSVKFFIYKDFEKGVWIDLRVSAFFNQNKIDIWIWTENIQSRKFLLVTTSKRTKY